MAKEVYQSYIRQDREKGIYPPYKGIGMSYIRFAKEEREFSETGLDYETAYRFQTEMVFYIHGIASMIATSYVEINEETISGFLTDGLEALQKWYQDGGGK